MILRAALERFLLGWRDDLSPAWRAVLDGIDPAFRRVPEELVLPDDEIIFPARRGSPFARTPAGGHLFRALDSIAPDDVRVVVLGPHPYPNVAHATGRSFEQGGLTAWSTNPTNVLDGLQRIVQAMVSARTGRSQYLKGDTGWLLLMGDLQKGKIVLDSPPKLFEKLEREGVLFLNTELTRSGEPGDPKQQIDGHALLWQPIVERILVYLATRPAGQVVYLLCGQRSIEVFAQSGIQNKAVELGSWGVRIDAVLHSDPSAPAPLGTKFLEAPNPFVCTNDRLVAMGGVPIGW